MSIFIANKKSLLVLFVLMITNHVYSQNKIEKYLVEQNLISTSQLKKYKDKEKADDEYVRLMIRLMKKDKGDREYPKEMEKEYKEEIKKKEQNKDTLSILADILEGGAEKRYADDTITNQLKQNFIDFIHQLRNKKLISDESIANLLNRLNDGWLYDSSRIVRNAIGFKNKAAVTTPAKLKRLSTLFKDLGLISNEKYQKLVNESFSDSTNPVKHIVAACEKTFISASPAFIKGKDQFDAYMSEFSRLTGIQVSNAEMKFNTLKKDSQEHRYNPIVELYHNGKKYSYTCYEVMYTSVHDNIYSSGLDFYKIFNFIFAGKNSPLRLYSITEKNPLDYSYTHVWNGFIVLTEPQAEGLYHNENVEISYEERLPTLTKADIQRAVSIYRKAGIFDRVSQSTVDSVINDAKENPLFRYNELISRFPAISLLINEDKTITENEAVALVKRLAEISNYAFNPQNAKFEKEANGITWFLMDINGKTYKEMFISGWTSIWSVVHNAVFSDLKRTGQFEVNRLNQHEEVIIYVTPAQMKMLEKEKVIGDY